MRILILGCKEYPFGGSSRYDKKAGGGIEVHVEKLAKYLSRDGYDTSIITRKFPGQKEEEHINRAMQTYQGYASHAKGKIHIYRVGFRKNAFLRTFTFNRNAAKKARDIMGNIDIIHCHGPVAGFFGSELAKRFNKPMVFTPHGIVVDWPWPVRKIISYFERRSFRKARKNIFVSGKAMKELGGNAENSVLLSNAVDMDDYRKTRKRRVRLSDRRSEECIRFLFLGRLEDVKGIDYLLDAFKKLSDEQENVELYIGGEGRMKKTITQFVNRNRLNDKVKILGWVKAGEVFPETDVFVLPSWEKGQPVALLEAMASGMKIITSLDYIEDKKTGLLIKPKDTEDLYEKMLYVCKNPAKCMGLGKAAQARARTEYTWEKVIKRIEAVYNEVANG